MSSCLINDKVSLKQQLLVSYSFITIISAGITLGICYGLLFSLKDSASTTATNNLISQTNSNAQALATEIANTINQQIATVGESVCMVSAQYASILLANAHNGSHGGTILKQQPSYREYHFNGTCSVPNCPSDYGALLGRSRLPPRLPGFIDGSILHSSVYMYSSTLPGAARNNQTWTKLTSSHPSINSVINALAFQDRDMNLMYTQGPNSTVMFYLSTKISLTSGDYVSVHRTLPGIVKNNNSYDPTIRSWFKKAPMNSYYLNGPYVETFTKQPVITLSSMKTGSDSETGESLKTVAAAVMLISELSTIVNSVKYTDGGFGVLFSKTTQEVLVWKDQSYQTVFPGTINFKTIADFDSNLATQPITSSSIFEYTDPPGVKWIVSPYPFFLPGSTNNPSNSGNQLVILVFARRSLAVAALDSLNSNISTTTNNILISTIIIIACTIGATILLCFLLIEYIAGPLEAMRRISEEIAEMSAEDEDRKDYRSVLDKAYVNLNRTDEVGLLAAEYYYIVCLLHNKNIAKKEAPKYPPNPFHLGSDINYDQLSWVQFISTYESRNNVQVSRLPVATEEAGASSDLDVLGSLISPVTATAYIPVATTIPNENVKPMIMSDNSNYINVPKENKKVGWFTSLKSQLYFMSFILLVGVTVTMLITVISVSTQGVTWMNSSTTEIDNTQVVNMQAITDAKSVFAQTYYQQLSTDVITAAAYMTDLFNQNLTEPNWYKNRNYLKSHSANYYDTKHKYIATTITTDFSLYYATDYAFCNPSAQCDVLYNSTQTTLSSLSDLKLRSYFHSYNFISFIQFAEEEHGFTRYLPFTGTSTSSNSPSNPTSCQITYPTTDLTCLKKYLNSKCNDPSKTSYDPYDPRCRSWYLNGKASKEFSSVSFQGPRATSSRLFVQTAYIPLRSKGAFVGVMSTNYLASKLSTVINTNRILSSGYCYLIDTNSSELISHPSQTSSCSTLLCAEGFSSSEYTAFESAVLNPIKFKGALPGSSVTYKKQGKSWRITSSRVDIGTVQYTVFATVPNSEVEKTSTDTTTSINKTVVSMIIAFAFCIFGFLLFLFLYSWFMITSIVNPVNDLRASFLLIRSDDLSRDVPAKASSSDMKVLMEAFSKLMIALRFGSESYAKGDPGRAKAAFAEALDLFVLTGNKKGMGSSQNNLAAAELGLGNKNEAELYSKQAILNAEELLRDIESRGGKGEDIDKARRVLSDRKGNLAIIYLQQDRFADAFEVLEQLLAEDKKNLYIRGLVVKQGTLGQYYLKQGELKSAEKIFRSALDFIRRKDENMFNSEWNVDEASTAEQIALFNLATLHNAQKDRSVETYYLNALCRTSNMHTATVTKTLLALKELFDSANRRQDAALLDKVAVMNEFDLYAKENGAAGSGAGGPKRVAFVIDYSGSMSGSKIKSAIENVLNIFQTHINDADSIMVMTFSGSVMTDLPMTRKKGNEEMISSKISSLVRPNGGTAFYSAIEICLAQLSNSNTGHTSSDWIIALTDGDDNCSGNYCSPETVNAKLRVSNVGVVIIGIGNDVQTQILQGIADATANKKGTYVFAQGDKKSIDDAFSQVATLIQGTLVMEDM